eukprot:TRINITY_DN1440_c0_g1_i2.p1 TRINITY_DN1440_c0_g1~~TRINITY_DN1440_c0_g1_i2.p1  ORF type:complete len:496 (-),score=150.94 TRINITY_DN1440_c0_g1_i2:70-1557(-)
MIRRPPRSTLSSSSAASDVYKRQGINAEYGASLSVEMASSSADQVQGDQALIIQIRDGSEGTNAQTYLNVNRAVAVRESGYIRGAVARDRRVVCGIGAIILNPETFGPLELTQDVLQLALLRQFFSFLQNKETVQLIVRTRQDLAQLEHAYEEGRRQIEGDASQNTVFKVLKEEFLVQHGALSASLQQLEQTLPAMGLTPEGTLSFLVACEMFDCSAAASTLIALILSDFGSYSSLSAWQNPWLEKSFKTVVQSMPEAELSRHPAPDFNTTVGHIAAFDTIASAPDSDTALAIDARPSSSRPAAACSLADKIKQKLKKAEKGPAAATAAAPKPARAPATTHKRSAVRLREREKALAELRDKFYETPMAASDKHGAGPVHPSPAPTIPRSIALAAPASELPSYYKPMSHRSTKPKPVVHTSHVRSPTQVSAAKATSPTQELAAAAAALSPRPVMAPPAEVRQAQRMIQHEARQIRAHETVLDLVCRLLLEKKKKKQ